MPGVVNRGESLVGEDDAQLKFALGNASHMTGRLRLRWRVWELLLRSDCSLKWG